MSSMPPNPTPLLDVRSLSAQYGKVQALQPAPPPRSGDAQDHAPRQVALPAATPAVREPTAWLLLAIVLLFALERWMASNTRRRLPA